MSAARAPGLAVLLAATATLVCAAAGCAPQEPANRLSKPQLRDRAWSLLTLMASAEDPRLRTLAIEAMAETDAAAGLRYYRDSLADRSVGNTVARFAACMAVGQNRLAEARDAVEANIDDADPSVQAAAAFALARMGDLSRTDRLVQLTFHSRPNIRANAFRLIGMLEDPRLEVILKRAVVDDDISVRWEGQEALARLGNEQIIEQLLSWSNMGYPDERIRSMQILGQLRIARAAPVIDGQRLNPYDEVRLAAVRSLGLMGDPVGMGFVQSKLREKEKLVYDDNMSDEAFLEYQSGVRIRSMAAMAAGAIGREELLPHLAARLNDQDRRVRIAAAKAIIETIDRGPHPRITPQRADMPNAEPGGRTIRRFDTPRGEEQNDTRLDRRVAPGGTRPQQ